MTSPEALKARQHNTNRWLLIVGVGLLIIAGVLVWQIRDTAAGFKATTTCISTSFTDLGDSLTQRSAYSTREAATARLESKAARMESRANDRLDNANARFYRDAFSSTTQGEVFDAYADYRIVKSKVDEAKERVAGIRERVRAKRKQIRADRAANPIPDFPKGTCVEDTDENPDDGKTPDPGKPTEKD